MSSPVRTDASSRSTFVSPDSRRPRKPAPAPAPLRTLRSGCALAATLCLAACAVGPDYHKPPQDIPATFKEGADWQRAQANPQGALSSTWWLDYHDDTLSHLVDQSLKANQSIAAAEAAYRVAKATIDANVASLFPTIGVDASGSRSRTAAAESITGQPYTSNLVSASASASWEIDLWGSVRRSIESAKASAQASDAQLAGERLSIAASLAIDYFALRQADIDIDSLKQQQQIDANILEMDRAGFLQGTVSNDDVLDDQDNLELVIADLQATETSREQDEHAIAVLIGEPPASFTLPAQSDYAFATPAVPLGFPSQLLERRYDVVSAERTAAAANAKIGVAEAAFFPTLRSPAQGGFEHNALAHLFSMPSRFWTLGPDLAATIFDGGARTAAVHEAEATYDAAGRHLSRDRAVRVPERRGQPVVLQPSAAAGAGVRQHLQAQPAAFLEPAGPDAGRHGEPGSRVDAAAHAVAGRAESEGHTGSVDGKQRHAGQKSRRRLAVG